MQEHRVKIGIVFLIVFIDLVGFGIVIPILPLYAEKYGPSPLVFGLLMASFSIMQFIFAPILGRLSDRIGRRPVLLVSLVGSAVGYVLFGIAGSIGMLFASRIIDGISGGNISTAHAVITDITGPEDRAKGMGLIGAAFGLGFILGPAIGALLVTVAPWMPGIAAAVASTIAFFLVLTLLPETLETSSRTEARKHPLSPQSLARTMAHPLMGLCMLMAFCTIFAFANFETTFAQFAKLRFSFSISTIAWLFVYAGILGAVVQGGLVGKLSKRFGEARLIVAGTFLSFLALGVLPYVPNTGSLLAILAVLALGQGIAHPSLSALTSKLADPDEVGGVMGVFQGMSSLARIIGPFWAEVTYGRLGFAWPFRTGSVFMLVACVIAATAMVRLGRQTPAAAINES
ncbi:MAG: MFS transporter [Acidobacteriota bacterium]|nr:MFS transporter [Acidobacteriota bacterium]